MGITGSVWMALTIDERMIVLRFAVEENQKRWNKKKTLAG